MMSMGLLTACVAPGPAPMPLAASGPVAISQDGVGYLVDLQPTLSGAQVTVVADRGAMTMDQGLAAKRAAGALCESRGSRLEGRALGRFVAGSWVFDGGCV
jgi:hypothetical protein